MIREMQCVLKRKKKNLQFGTQPLSYGCPSSSPHGAHLRPQLLSVTLWANTIILYVTIVNSSSYVNKVPFLFYIEILAECYKLHRAKAACLFIYLYIYILNVLFIYIKILCSFFGVTLFQAPYFWPTQKWVAEDTDYGEYISLSAGLFFLKTAKYWGTV